LFASNIYLSLTMRALQSATLARHLTARYLSTAAAAVQRDSQTFTLPDGRTLGYAEHGPSTGRPLVFLHGFPTSRLEAAGVAPTAESHNVRVISPDRPGFGLSSPQPGRRIVDFPADVAALLDHLGLERVPLLGGSGGGPYALACAKLIPERLSQCGVLAGAPPYTLGGDMPLVSRIFAVLVARTPGLTERMLSASVGLATWAVNGPARKQLDNWLAQQGSEDTAAAREDFMRLMLEGFRQGPAATVEEARLLSTDWEFAFEDIAYDTVKIWHGVHDARAPIGIMRDMAARIPHCSLVEFEENGHFDIHWHLDAVLAEMLK
jgi:pimeloyl-ACP methyl ester carboxylesterase